MNDNKIPTTLNDVINKGREPSVYNTLNVEERLKYLTIYVQQNKRTNHNQHKAIIEMTDKEFSKQNNEPA
tara:strand:- start:578 stop:787 length:210 start_codon:yes stop_codon:yes gene_type:complete